MKTKSPRHHNYIYKDSSIQALKGDAEKRNLAWSTDWNQKAWQILLSEK